MIKLARKRARRLGGIAAAIAYALPVTVNAQEIGDAAQGFAFALEHCAKCHAVKAGETYSPNPGAPNFTSVATTPGMSGRALAVWLDNSHPTMPNFILHAEERNNVIAYIMSLKPPPSK